VTESDDRPEVALGATFPDHARAMSSLKEQKLSQKAALQQQQVALELNALVKEIERCEKTIFELQSDLTTANAKYPSPRTTRQDIDYLTELLKCANKKLVWEKQILSLNKRMPALLERLSAVVADPQNPPSEERRGELMRALQGVQGAMERLQAAKIT
jgi:hypothetical protein